MGTKDKRVDAYIAKAAPFAQPILVELRARLHANCPEVEETIKWSMPAFEYRGLFAGMGAFKKHCVFGFWKHALVVGDNPQAKEAMGSFGCLTEVAQLPTKAQFAKFVKTAMELNDKGVKVARTKHANPKLALHPEFAAALKKHKAAKAGLEGLPPSQQRDYLVWIDEAKRDETRAKRIEQALEWLAEGKPRNWKYMKR